MLHKLLLVFSLAWLLRKLSWLNVSSNLIGFYTSIQHSIPHSSTSPVIRAEAVLSTEHAFEHILSALTVLNSLLKKWKEKSSDATCAALYEAYKQIHVSEAQFACISSKD